MSGFVDLHLHYLPGVDDGVRSVDEARELLRGLASLGFSRAVTTPHMRSGYFENEAAGLRAAMATLEAALEGEAGLPALGLGAEHHLDDVVAERLLRGEGLPYPGGRAALIELPEARFPLGLPQIFFELMVRGLRPVIAHPERYAPLFRTSAPLEALLERGAAAQLDLMSLLGKYGKNQQNAAERMLDEGLYLVASTDAHKPAHLPLVERALGVLEKRVGRARFEALLVQGPKALLDV